MTREPGQAQTGKDVKKQFKPITEAELEGLAGSGSYGRGLKYFRSGHISDAILRGDTLHAECEGSGEEPYRLSATLARAKLSETAQAAEGKPSPLANGAQITAYNCDCEAGGFCKHLVALLLTWINKPETVEVREAFAVRLQALSHEQLLKLCVKLLERQPDMEYLIDVAPPATAPVSEAPTGVAASDSAQSVVVSPLANTQTVDINAVRRKAQKSFRQAGSYDDYYDSAARIAAELEPLVGTGDEYAQAGQWANAQAIYETVAQEALDGYDELEDEGELAGLINDCCDGLINCLDAQATLPETARLNSGARQKLLQSLYALWEYDRQMGGIDLATGAVEAIARNVTPDERGEIENRLQNGMKSGSDFSSKFNNDARAHFIVSLKIHSGISDEEKLTEYSRLGLYSEVTQLLLAMGRVDEAMQVALEQTPEPAQLTAFADKLRALDGANVDRALSFIAEQQDKLDAEAGSTGNVTYARWLGERYAQHNQPEKALEAQLRLFRAAPSQYEYRSVKRAAQLPGNPDEAWTRLRSELIGLLEERKMWRDLIEIYIEEKQARQALDTLVLFEETTTRWMGGDLYARVAGVAEADFPDESRVIYQLLAENLIEQRGRDNYRLAASYLARAKDLAGRANRLVEWNRYLAVLRENNNRLPALKEELKARNLL